MRIVAGAAKGRPLRVPAAGTRPTSDRAREALFNSLAGALDLDGATVLDLFAGTGAVGLESLSRGARRAVFVESDRDAYTVLRRNVEAVAIETAITRRRRVESYLGASSADGPFDFVFADPPYALSDAAVTALLDRLTSGDWLVPGAVLVVERSARGVGPTWPDCVTPWRDKRYGEGVLWYGRAR